MRVTYKNDQNVKLLFLTQLDQSRSARLTSVSSLGSYTDSSLHGRLLQKQQALGELALGRIVHCACEVGPHSHLSNYM